jgi:hypothetical protein
MNLEKRDEHLDEVLGIKEPKEILPEIVEELDIEETLPAVVNENSTDIDVIKSEMVESKSKLEIVYDRLGELLESATDTALSFSKARDVDAVAHVAATMIALRKEIRETNNDIADKSPKKEANNVTNNAIFVGNSRELLDLINGKKK